MPTQRVNQTYSGLKRYTDTQDPSGLLGFEGPNIVIALEKDQGDLFSSTAPKPAGQFELIEASANNIIGALAKGEVYFKRPSDLSYFKREDGFEEIGNAFSPYWHARLAPLTHADRVVATLQQHSCRDYLPTDNPDSYGAAPGGEPPVSPPVVQGITKTNLARAWTGGWPPAYTASGGPNFRCTGPAPIPCTVPVVSNWMPTQRVNQTYSGLKRYTDTQDPSGLLGFEGPNIVIALEKDQGDLFSSTAPKPAGQFELIEASANNIIGALAKGEVYFKRPSDLSYFKREDGFEEIGNAFSPYWHARLAPLTHADRVVATLQQHGENFDSGASISGFNTIPWDLLNWIP